MYVACLTGQVSPAVTTYSFADRIEASMPHDSIMYILSRTLQSVRDQINYRSINPSHGFLFCLMFYQCFLEFDLSI